MSSSTSVKRVALVISSGRKRNGWHISVMEHFGRLDVLVNCAAIYRAQPLESITAADLRDNFEANLLGTFLCVQQAGMTMVRQSEGGGIVNFGDWALIRPYLNYAAYFATKGAIPALTRYMVVRIAVAMVTSVTSTGGRHPVCSAGIREEYGRFSWTPIPP